ncbi:quinone oxidoreductase-like protein 1 isoform X3 [Thamnophis elegans]|uniref:quinone oxidoreductase-like protein 1 isoform X3 n=1 Tax=Thamnophis elegans TaxID=35005 RepID=UPI0013766DAD|nr:quinone oxidoreductase-like protein 1 isoform X3 [Thamnophis elegans]
MLRCRLTRNPLITMKGLYWQQNSEKEREFIFLEKDSLPIVSDHHVKVQVKACALSWIDKKFLSEIKKEKKVLPVGREIAGVVLEIGNKVSSFKIQDEVVGILPLDSEESGLCEEILVHEHYLVRIIDVSNGKYDLTESCLEETGGLGVDIIIDAGVRLHNKDNETTSQQLLPHKHDIITLLSAAGHWITTEKNLQLDPPDCRYLFLKGASVSFLNEEIWNLSSMQQGKYLSILEDVMEKLSSGVFKPYLDKPLPLYEAKVSMELVQKNQARKKQVIQL